MPSAETYPEKVWVERIPEVTDLYDAWDEPDEDAVEYVRADRVKRLEEAIRGFFRHRYGDVPLVNIALGTVHGERQMALAVLGMEPHEAMEAYRAALAENPSEGVE